MATVKPKPKKRCGENGKHNKGKQPCKKKNQNRRRKKVYVYLLQESRARVKFLENQLRDMRVEHELLLQAFEKVR